MNNYIKSPLNYIGGKYKTLNQIIPLFPKKINTFVDLFGGGFNVGVNVNANKIIYNDIITPLCDLINYFYNNDSNKVIKKLEKNIETYNLNKENLESFIKLREKYNNSYYENEEEKIIDFYTLILYSFNYQIRFNKKMKYNTPFGKNRSSYNNITKKNLILFINKLNKMNLEILNYKFNDFDFSNLKKNDLVYCDPPYLITTGSYNDGNRGIKDWTEKEERDLLKLLDELHSKGIKFALSNVFMANGQKNEILLSWAKKYKVYIINNTFDNSNYRRKCKNDTVEVLITNLRRKKK